MPIQINPASLWRQVMFWLLSLAVFVIFLLVFSSILLPFIAGMALAYFLDPVADWLERRGLSRMWATVFILIGFIVVFALSLMIVIPLIASQAADFIEKMPGYITKLQELLTDAQSSLVPGWISSQMGQIKENSAKLLEQGAGFLGTLFQQLWNSGVALLDIISLFIITPVVAFYLLLDWDRMIAKVDSWVPRPQLATVRQIARDMDTTIAGFVRGQGSLCIILGLYYGIGLSLVGLNFGLLIGLFSGVISFIPYVGSMIGLVLALGIALVQFWPDYTTIIVVLVIFFSGQFLEGNILQPRLVGKSVGLHPVWLMFALLAFGALFGFVGLLVAVPAAAALGVLVRFALGRYLESDLYHGHTTLITPAVPKTLIVSNEEAIKKPDGTA
ncbi:AI-2E family transporter [Rhizobium sp. 32-5/1]|uniref:AI-2E family transporter n=1 Tax=Rhizobium sp. 32-5/1 TaxID=3019602 RepID=UPI00240DC966|nr:AI-2E family transporter [Rhizobium sp. 32-5/1]WEZ83860.1 AI-2E family transporter [Rhizobium sp. 32-5/1]